MKLRLAGCRVTAFQPQCLGRRPRLGRLRPSASSGSTNPWDIVEQGHNLSAYERNRVFLNVQGRNFLDISYLTGADSDGDGRSVVAGDFRNDGRLDLVVRQVGGGPVLLFENQFPKAHYLTVSLRGTASNRLGIGARLTATVAGRELTPRALPAQQLPFADAQPCALRPGRRHARSTG